MRLIHLFHKWVVIDNLRKCSICGKEQGFCQEKGKWLDLEYLVGTNLDDGYWLFLKFREPKDGCH